MVQKNGEKILKKLREGHFEITQTLSLYCFHLNWNLLAFLPELSHFDLENNSNKQVIEIRILRLCKIKAKFNYQGNSKIVN